MAQKMTGALVFDERTDRYDIRFDLNSYYGGLHCGECFDVFVRGKWKPTRIEYGDNWYLVGMLNEFIYKILVHEREQKGRQDSPQTIEIYFNFVGKFETPNMKQGPTAEERELAERKARIAAKRHEQYLRSKSTGWQSTYYWKKKREKKAKMDAMREALRAEDRENGVYYLPNADKSAH